MREPNCEVGVWLTLDELSRVVAVSPDWLTERVRAGLIEAAGESPAAWRFDALVVRRVRSMQHTERCFGAVPELAALVADLEDQIAQLRARLSRLER
jgi:chaperone modulatory protein CbpM